MHNPKWYARIATLSLVLTLNGFVSHAQNSSPQSQSFTPADFAQVDPRSALELLQQIPGFQIEQAENKRGLGQGGANVLVDGERLSGKTDVFDQLSKISIKRVSRVEIMNGARLEIPGLTGAVANVVTQSAGTTGNWSWSSQFRDDRRPMLLDAELSITREFGDLTATFGLENESFRGGVQGPERVTVPGSGLIETRDEDAHFFGDTLSGSMDLAWKNDLDHVANLDLRIYQHDFEERELSKREAVTVEGITGQSRFDEAVDEWGASLNADYERPIGPGKLKSTLVLDYEYYPNKTQFDFYDGAGLDSGSQFSQQSDKIEAILRGEYSWSPRENRDWQIALESAYNSLDISSALADRDANGDFVAVELDQPESKVEEQRFEATLTHSRPLSPKLDIQATIGAEYSEITQSGGGEIARDFIRPKGFLSTSYAVSDTLTLRGRLERKVGQLNFFDFISSVNVNEDLQGRGNPDLVPDQTWLTEFELEKIFEGGSNFKVRLFHEDISDIVDRIPIGDDGDAVGNIDSATRYGVAINSSIVGDRWGWTGTKLDIELDLSESELEDPITGEIREINRNRLLGYEVDFRHDIEGTDWAYGAFAEGGKRSPVYKLDTIFDRYRDKPFAGVFVEHKDVFGLNVRTTLRNIVNRGDGFRRDFYDARRDVGVVNRVEDRVRTFPILYRISVSGDF